MAPRLVPPSGEVPACPLCDGPCTVEFHRSEYRIPDKLPRGAGSEPLPVPVKKRKRKKPRRMKQGPESDRMRRLSEDRAS